METIGPVRNTCRTVVTRDPYTFALTLGRRTELVSEHHDGDTTVLTIRRNHGVRLEEVK